MPKRTDANHAQCRDNLRATGWTVIDTHHAGGGFFDLIAAKHGRVVFIEVKDGSKPPSERRLTPDEQKLHQELLAAGAEVYVWEDAMDLSYFNRPLKDALSYDDVQLGARLISTARSAIDEDSESINRRRGVGRRSW